MRYFQIAYPDENGKDVVEVLSEDDVCKQYWPYWYQRMCDKYGQKEVDEKWSFQDCLDDWIVVHWAVEVDETWELENEDFLKERERVWTKYQDTQSRDR